MIIHLPIYIILPRVRVKDKRVSLNLNTYRNLYHITNNQTKVAFNEIVAPRLKCVPSIQCVAITYRLFPKTRQLCDISNICCVVDKFFCDCLIHNKKLPDDNYKHVLGVRYLFGSIDKNNPRVEATLHIKK